MAPGIALNALPDQLLVHIFGNVDASERHRNLALVCKSWSQLVCSPQLLRSLSICIRVKQPVPRTLALCAWLLEHAAGHVERLELHIGQHCVLPEADGIELAAALTASLAACDAEGRLRELHLTIDVNSPFSSSGWLAVAVRHVRRLYLCGRAWTPVTAPLHLLADLEQLELADGLYPTSRQRLPPSLSKLCVHYQFSSQSLPIELTSLSNLRCLHLRRAGFADDGYGPLPQLSGLTELKLHTCKSVDATTLTALTTLQRLQINDANKEDLVALQSGLQHLQQLTRLVVQAEQDEEFALLAPGLSQLSRLQQFCWGTSCPQSGALPPGPWLANLRQLAVPADIATRSLQLLGAAAQQLTYLCTTPIEMADDLAVLGWAAQEVPLRKLCLVRNFKQPPAQISDAILHAQSSKPFLCIQHRRSPLADCLGQPEALLDGP